jgi:hypothetical protein
MVRPLTPCRTAPEQRRVTYNKDYLSKKDYAPSVVAMVVVRQAIAIVGVWRREAVRMNLEFE